MPKRRVVEFRLHPGQVYFNGIEAALAELAVEQRAGARRPSVVSGYAALFDTPRTVYEGFREVIRPGAFTRTLEEGGFEGRGVWGTWDHGRSPEGFWGHTRNAEGPGSLRVWEDERGLRFEGEPFESTANDHWLEGIRTRTIVGSSFSFFDRGSTARQTSSGTIRELRDVDLADVSAVRDPAYVQASVEARGTLIAHPEGLLADLRARGLRFEEIESILAGGLESLRGAHSGPTPRRDALTRRVRELVASSI